LLNPLADEIPIYRDHSRTCLSAFWQNTETKFGEANPDFDLQSG
jgi:hypothetical protein